MVRAESKHQGTIILGAGLSGLGCARLLPGARIYEAQAYVGGHAYSHPACGFHFDEGAHICHARDQSYLDLIYGASTGGVRQISSSRVVNRRRGRWITYPVQNHLHELETGERIRALTDFVRAQIGRGSAEPANYLEWCRAQYGDFLTDNFYADYTAKYWRVGMADLATDWLSGRLLPAQVERILAGTIAAQPETQAVFAQFHYPKTGGYMDFYRRLYDGLDVHCGHRAVEIDARKRVVRFANGTAAEYETLASSLPLPVLIAMMGDVPPAVREAAAKLRHTQLLCVNVVVARPNLTELDWFYIYDRDIEPARVSVPSNLGDEPAAQTHSALQAEVFRRDDETWDVPAVVENTVANLSRILDFRRDEVTGVWPVMVPHAYIISNADRATASAYVVSWLKDRGIYSMGLGGKWKFIWSDAAFRDGEATAREIVNCQKA